MRELSPVITLAGMREALAGGEWVEIVCVKSAEQQSNQYRGQWKFYVCTAKGDHKLLYVYGRDIKPKIVKTVTGLVSMAIDLGVDPVCFPTVAGDRAIWKHRNDRAPDT